MEFLSAELVRLIASQARSLGYATPEEYLRTMLSTSAGPRSTALPDEEFVELIEQLASEDLPSLPRDFSRADIYADHDRVARSA